MNLNTILERHAGVVMDRQHVLGENLGAHDWTADTESGMIFFGGPNLESPFEIIGAVSKTRNAANGEWLWGWANASLPGDLAAISGKLRDIGLAGGIDLFTRERFTATKEDMHAMGVAACGLGGAAGYYIADHGDGALLVALTGKSVMRGWRPDHSRVFTVFPKVIQLFALNHRTALRHYLTSLGYTVREEDGFLAGNKDGRTVAATFDGRGGLAALGEGG